MTPRFFRPARALVIAACVAFSLTLLGGAAHAQAEVNVYTSRHYDSDALLYAMFEEATGIRVNAIQGGEDELIERLRSEGRNSPADIFFTADAGRLWRAEQADILQPITSETLEAAIAANLRHPDGLWFGLSRRARVIVYHRANVDTPPTTYEELADEAWRGRVCVRSSSNIYNQSLVASLIEHHGTADAEAWGRGLVANFARPPEGNDTAQVRAVAVGQCDVAIVNHYYLARLLASADPADTAVAEVVGVVFPNQDGRGTHVNISGAGVTRSAPHPENAIRFLEFLVTPEAQAVFVRENFEYPVVDGVPLPTVLDDLGPFVADVLDVAAYGRNNPAAVMLMDRVGWR
ncbi:MAG: Fe(3+) ABC transporter substrate-binding protein [Trueperaceae bacterium]